MHLVDYMIMSKYSCYHYYGDRYGYDTTTRAIFGKLYHDMTKKTPRGGGRRAKVEVPLLNFQIFSLIIL